MKKLYLAWLCIASASAVSAQTAINETSAEGYLSRGMLMYESRNYTGCIDQLTEAKRAGMKPSLEEDADYYIALASFRLGNGTGALRQFLDNYPASAYRFEAWSLIGDSHFFAGRYGEAILMYGKVPDNAFDSQTASGLIYRRAFAYLKLAEFDRAKREFDKIKNSKGYREASDFYSAYILYAKGDYDAAEPMFERVSRNSAFRDEAQYYLCQIRFRAADYEEVVAKGNELLSAKFPIQMASEMKRMVGESEYHLGNNERAVELLEAYVQECENAPERTSLYILGLAEFRNGNNMEAVSRLDAVTDADDALAQSAYLYIGQIYLREGNMTAASMAFEKAYKMEYDRDVQETAFYNYAIAQSQGGRVPFSNSISIFEDFLNRFPKSKYASGVEDYIISSYMSGKDYDNALSTISKIKKPSSKMLKAKQEVLYRLGLRELSAGNAVEAVNYLQKADQLAGYDKAVANETALCLGEAYYRTGNYAKAQACYSRYVAAADRRTANYVTANYGLGYACFQQRRYADASVAFGKVVAAEKAAPAMKSDAYNRMGDCLYYGRDYAKAESYYEKAVSLNAGQMDYALFQKGFMRGLQRRHAEKISIMDEVVQTYPNSAYAPKAMYEKAQAYIAIDKNKDAENAFNALMRKYPQSAEARQGQLQLAMLFNAEGKRNEARKQYEDLVRKAPSSEEAKVAIEDLKVMYADDNNLAAFTKFVRSVDSSYTIDENEMDRLSFQSAESEYVAEGKTSRLKTYLSSYPKGRYAGQAAYYIAENAYRNKAMDEAYEYAEKALSVAPDAAFAETALAMQGEILMSKNKVSAALKCYEKLEEKATTAANKRIARIGQLRIVCNSDRAKAVKIADGLIADGGLSNEEMSEVAFIRAEALQQQKKTEEAKKGYQQLAGNMGSLYGSKATVKLAEIYFSEKKYNEAEKLLNKFINSGTPHQYWLARGFILLSDVYKERGDKFQAREYLESLQENYPGKEADIADMIKTRLNALKK